MSEIMRQFGQTVLVAAAFGLLMTLLFVGWPGGGNILSDIGTQSSQQLDDRAVTGTGTDNFSEHSGRSLPVVAGRASALQGETFLLADKFNITSSDGAVWNQSKKGFMLGAANKGGLVQIESIVSADGTEHIGGLTGNYDTAKVKLAQSTGVVSFKEPGVYRVRIRVMDYDNVEATFTIPFVVDFVLSN